MQISYILLFIMELSIRTNFSKSVGKLFLLAYCHVRIACWMPNDAIQYTCLCHGQRALVINNLLPLKLNGF